MKFKFTFQFQTTLLMLLMSSLFVKGQTSPIFTSTPITSVTIGNNYVYNITIEDLDGDLLSITAPTLPSWLSLTIPGGGLNAFAGTGILPTTNGGVYDSPVGTLATSANVNIFSGGNGLHAIDGKIFFSDVEEFGVRYIDEDKKVQTFFAGDGNSSTLNVASVQFDSVTNTAYIAHYSDHKIVKSVNGGPLEDVATDIKWFVFSLLLDKPNNKLYAGTRSAIFEIDLNNADLSTNRTLIVGDAAFQGSFSDNGIASTSNVNQVTAMAFDANGDLIFVDRGNDLIRKVDLQNNTIVTIAGTQGSNAISGDGNLAVNATFQDPTGIAIHPNGKIYITERLAKKIRIINTDGKIYDFATVPTSGFLSSLTISADNKLFIGTNTQIFELNTDAILSGTPTSSNVGIHPVQLRLEDADQNITTQSFDIEVLSLDAIWNGSIDSSWHTDGNWSTGSVPSSNQKVVIPNNSNNSPIVSQNIIIKDLELGLNTSITISPLSILKVNNNITNNGQIIFKSDATGSGMFDEFTGTITGTTGTVQVERYIPAKRAFRFLSPSITTTSSIYANWQENGVNASGLGTHITGTGGTTNGFDTTATNNPSMFGFDHATGQWTAVTNTNTNTLTAGTPYRLMVRGDRTTDLTTNTPTATATTLRATGALHTGDYTPTLNQVAEGYSFIGNPYQAPLDMEAVLTNSATNMNTDVLYYWDPTLNVRGAYVTRTLSANSNNINSNFTEILQPGQAVFVKSSAANPTMTITESHKRVSQGTAGVFRNATTTTNVGLLRANLQANINNQWQTTDAALALFNDSYSWNVSQEDASKMNNLDEEVSFIQNNTSLAIAKQNDASETDELPIRLQQLRHTNYRWVFDLNNYNGYTPYLFDTEQNTLSVIENGTVLPFTTGSNTSNRFKIVFQNTTLSSPTFDNQISLYPNPSNGANGFYMTNITANAKVTLFNLLGQSVPVSTSLNGTTLQVKPMHDVAKGIYVVQVTSEDGATQQVKWIVE